MLDRCILVMQECFESLVVSVRTPREHLDVPQLCDQEEMDRAPMAGVLSALEQVETPWVFAIACDMPFICTEIISHMAGCRGDQQAVAAVVGGNIQPLAAFYSKDVLPEMRRRMHGGDRSLRKLLSHIDTTFVEESQLKKMDSGLHAFLDLDTNQDVSVAAAILESSR